MRLSNRLRIAFAVEALVLLLVATAAADLYAHKRTDMVAGRNIWGYRGAVAHQRAPGDIRFAVVGGTRAFGLGLPATWTAATVLQQEVMLTIDRPGGVVRHFTALNLAQPSALAESYARTIEHFAYLRPDGICLYDDLGVGGGPLLDESSGLYARTGYLPALPLVLGEKKSPMLKAAGVVLGRVDGAFARPPRVRETDSRAYVAAMMYAIDVASQHAPSVVVVLSPAESRLQALNRAALLPALQGRLAASPQLRLVDLSGIPELLDPQQRLDEWNYGGDATAVAARAIAPAVLALIRAGTLDR